MTLDIAQEAFEDNPSTITAGRYLAALLEYASDDMIGDDTFLDGVRNVSNWLRSTTP